MYNIGQLVVYGNHGVCEVKSIGPLAIAMDKNKQYYTLEPAYKKDETVYAAVDNNAVVMRPIISKDEADSLIKMIPDIDLTEVINEKERELQYKAALKTCDCKAIISIIKTLWNRKQDRIKCGKKATVIDERYFKQAEDQLFGELAIVLEKTKDEISSSVGCYFEV